MNFIINILRKILIKLSKDVLEQHEVLLNDMNNAVIHTLKKQVASEMANTMKNQSIQKIITEETIKFLNNKQISDGFIEDIVTRINASQLNTRE